LLRATSCVGTYKLRTDMCCCKGYDDDWVITRERYKDSNYWQAMRHRDEKSGSDYDLEVHGRDITWMVYNGKTKFNDDNSMTVRANCGTI